MVYSKQSTDLHTLAESIFKLFLREPYDGYFNAKPDEQLKSEIESLLGEAMEKAINESCC